MKKVLFIVNSLSNGGAERVCINMANEFINQNYDVDFIVLNISDKNSYDINPKINILNLNINSKFKLFKLIKMFFQIKRVNKFIRFSKQEYSLITSHLPMSNLLTRFSCVSKKAIYVFHLVVNHYEFINHTFYKKLLQFFFYKRKIVTVSDGIKEEAMKNYNMDSKYIKTIYNPINVSEILEKSHEKVEIIRPYFVCIGRFNDQKRQDRMVEIFYKGGFFHDYYLVFCGTGENEDKVKNQVRSLKIDNKVLFLGWQDNVYKYINNAELLINTSDKEGFPMNLIEAFACNVKVVSSNCNYGPKEIMKGEFSDYLVQFDNVDEYIEKIKLALKQYPNVCNKVLDLCNPSNVIEQYLLWYNSI